MTANGTPTLPPGQRAVEGFPRFGAHLTQPPPAIPATPTLELTGLVDGPLVVPLADLADRPRAELTSDFHCVAGWSALDQRWEGIQFAAFYRDVIEPRVPKNASITHFVFEALDGYRCPVLIEDALADDVLLADRLNGQPLNGSHGAPLRLVSPSQYGFVNVKHLSRIAAGTGQPQFRFVGVSLLSRVAFRLPVFGRHPRARVWHEERHPYLPSAMLRPLYRLTIPVINRLSSPRPR